MRSKDRPRLERVSGSARVCVAEPGVLASAALVSRCRRETDALDAGMSSIGADLSFLPLGGRGGLGLYKSSYTRTNVLHFRVWPRVHPGSPMPTSQFDPRIGQESGSARLWREEPAGIPDSEDLLLFCPCFVSCFVSFGLVWFSYEIRGRRSRERLTRSRTLSGQPTVAVLAALASKRAWQVCCIGEVSIQSRPRLAHNGERSDTPDREPRSGRYSRGNSVHPPEK